MPSLPSRAKNLVKALEIEQNQLLNFPRKSHFTGFRQLLSRYFVNIEVSIDLAEK